MKRIILGTLAALLTISGLPTAAPSAQSSGAAQAVAKADYDRWKTELSNWGRWGKDDQIGAVNLITPAKRRQAAALVKDGFSVSLARDVDTEKAVDNPQPYERQMLAIGSDRFGVAFHGVAHTHLDSLAHINYDGVFYNGYKPDPAAVMKAGGHARARFRPRGDDVRQRRRAAARDVWPGPAGRSRGVVRRRGAVSPSRRRRNR